MSDTSGMTEKQFVFSPGHTMTAPYAAVGAAGVSRHVDPATGANGPINSPTPVGLGIAVGPNGTHRDRLTAALVYCWPDLELMAEATATGRDLADEAEKEASEGMEDCPEAAAVATAEAALAEAEGKVGEVRSRLARQRHEYETAVKAGNYPRGAVAAMHELEDEIAFLDRAAEPARAAVRAARQALEDAGAARWGRAADARLADLAERRALLRERAEDFIRELAVELLEVASAEKSLRLQSRLRWTPAPKRSPQPDEHVPLPPGFEPAVR